jgi:hypothetical protein
MDVGSHNRSGLWRAVLMTCWAAAFVAATLCASATVATSSKPPYQTEAQRNTVMEDKFNRCGLIVVATITDKQSYRMENGKIFTKVFLDVGSCVRNSQRDSMDVWFWILGGRIGTKFMGVPDLPRFGRGQRWVLALPWSESGPRQGWHYGGHAVALQVVDGQVIDRYGLIPESGGQGIEVTREVPVDEYLQEIQEFLRVRDPDVLKEKCDLIVLGTVAEVVEHREVPRGTGQHAYVTLEIEDVLKGDLPGSELIFMVSLLQYPFKEKPPSFAEGERCVVFFSEDSEGDLSVVGGVEGKYVVEGEEVRNEFRSYPLSQFVQEVSQ